VLFQVLFQIYTPSDQRVPILSEGACQFLHLAMAVEGRGEGKGEWLHARTNFRIAYVTSQQGRASEVRHRHSLVRRVITNINYGIRR
jgi:hypothetical protein